MGRIVRVKEAEMASSLTNELIP